jgi:hypothetical protein
MMRVTISFLVVCLWIADAAAATLRLPVAVRLESRMVTTNAFFLVNATIVDAPLETWNPRMPLEKTFGDFLKEVAGPNPERAIGTIAQPPSGADTLPPATLIKLYQDLLKMPARRVLLSIDFPGRTLFFWKAAQTDGRNPRVATTVIRNEAGAFKVSAPSTDDSTAYLLLRSLQVASDSGQLERIMQPVSTVPNEAGYRLFDIAPGVQLGAKTSVFERSNPLSCTNARNATAALFVGCWLTTGTAFESAGQSWLSVESQSRMKAWLATLSPDSITQLKALPAGPAFSAVTFDLGPLAMVFPSMLSPVLGNKRSVYVTSSAPATIVNFFSADFADEIFLSAYKQTQPNQAK